MEKKYISPRTQFEEFIDKIDIIHWPFWFWLVRARKYKAMVSFRRKVFYQHERDFYPAFFLWRQIVNAKEKDTGKWEYDYKARWLLLHELGHVYQFLMYGRRKMSLMYIYQVWIKRQPHPKRYIERDANKFASTLAHKSPFEVRFHLEKRFYEALKVRSGELDLMKYQL